MGFFDNEARVSLSDVEDFKTKVDEFSNALDNVRYKLIGALQEEKEKIEASAEEMRKLADGCADLYQECKRLKRNIEEAIKRLQIQLQNTPKEIEIEKKGENGEVTVEKKPNPEYSKIAQEIKRQKSRLSKAKAASWDIYNKEPEVRRNSDYLFSRAGDVAQAIKSISYALQIMEQKTSSANMSLQRTEEAIEKYIRESI